MTFNFDLSKFTNISLKSNLVALVRVDSVTQTRIQLLFEGLGNPKKLEKAGFKIELFNPRKDLPGVDYQKMRLNPDELIYIAKKQ